MAGADRNECARTWQGGVFHAMISISAHASLLAEIAQLKQALAAEKELVAELGASAAPLRMAPAAAKAGPVVTDNGNLLIDAHFPAAVLADPAALDARLQALPGIVETGLFVGMARTAYFGLADGSVERVHAGGAAEVIVAAAAGGGAHA